jgi:UDP-glucose 6-dehydrogenase
MDDTFGIAGFGFVGQAVAGATKTIDSVGTIFDKYKELGKFEDLLKEPMIFCCLPTVQLPDGTQDFSEYKEFLDACIEHKYEGTLVIKSTVLPSHIAPYFSSDLDIVMNPEFLCQNNAIEDFRNQRVIILGGQADLAREVQDNYEMHFDLKKDPEYIICTPEEAIHIKYVHNIYHAYKVLFWNYVQGVTHNARKMSMLYHKITDRNELSTICADGKKGYGGACFPKDVNAFGHENPDLLTDFMRTYNTKLRGDEK